MRFAMSGYYVSIFAHSLSRDGVELQVKEKKLAAR